VPHRLSGLAVTCALALGGGLLATAPPAGAAASIAIVKVQYDASGYPDTADNSSVNGEYVVLRNVGTTTRCLTKWTLRDVAGHVYTFGSYCMAPGVTAYVHSGKGSDTATHLFWGSGWHIWNNTGDTAYLRTTLGPMDYCRWTSRGDGYVLC
jgi:hypothetical protein